MAIVREVAKVYGHREYHYIYPWQAGQYRGSDEVKENFKTLLRVMDDDPEGKYAYFYRGY